MSETPVETPKTGVRSLHCAAGNHSRCLGTVYDLTKGLVVCQCTPDCGHGTDTAKARRGRA